MRKCRTFILLIASILILAGCSDKSKKEETTTQTEELATISIPLEPSTDDMEIIASGEDTGEISTEIEIDPRYNPDIIGERMITEEYNKILLLEALMNFMQSEKIEGSCVKLEFKEKDPNDKGGYMAIITMDNELSREVQIYPRDAKWVMVDYIGNIASTGDAGPNGFPEDYIFTEEENTSGK